MLGLLNIFNKLVLKNLLLFLVTLSLPLALNAGQVQIKRDSYLLTEGSSPIYELVINITELNSNKQIYEEKFKRNQVGQLINLTSGQYKLAVSFDSNISSKTTWVNEYILNVNYEFIDIQIGKAQKSLINSDLINTNPLYGYGVSRIYSSNLKGAPQMKMAQRREDSVIPLNQPVTFKNIDFDYGRRGTDRVMAMRLNDKKNIASTIRIVCVNNNPHLVMQNSKGATMIQFIGNNELCIQENTSTYIVWSVPISKMQSGIFRSHCIHNRKFISYSPKNSSPSIIQAKINGQPQNC